MDFTDLIFTQFIPQQIVEGNMERFANVDEHW